MSPWYFFTLGMIFLEHWSNRKFCEENIFEKSKLELKTFKTATRQLIKTLSENLAYFMMNYFTELPKDEMYFLKHFFIFKMFCCCKSSKMRATLEFCRIICVNQTENNLKDGYFYCSFNFFFFKAKSIFHADYSLNFNYCVVFT